MNENNDVWALTLEKLNEILQLNQIKIHAMISSNEETDPTISQLIQLLMNCARCSDKKVTILAGACLGILGKHSSSGIRGCPCEMLQNLPYFWNTKT